MKIWMLNYNETVTLNTAWSLNIPAEFHHKLLLEKLGLAEKKKVIQKNLHSYDNKMEEVEKTFYKNYEISRYNSKPPDVNITIPSGTTFIVTKIQCNESIYIVELKIVACPDKKLVSRKLHVTPKQLKDDVFEPEF